MADPTLPRRAHQNLVHAFAVLPEHVPGGHVRRGDGVAAFVTGSPISTFNQVLATNDDPDPDAFEDHVEHLRGRGLAWSAHLRPGLDDELAQRAKAMGLTSSHAEPCMVLTDLPVEPELPPRATVEHVTEPAQFPRYLDAAAAGWGAPAEMFASWLSEPLLHLDHVGLFLVLDHDGQPAATSIAICTDGVAGVYSVSTLPGARRRGFGWAATSAAVAHGARLGCDMASLQASAMGRPVYAAHGFRAIYDYAVITEEAGA